MTPEAGTFRYQIKECCRWGQHNAFVDHENASQRVPALRLGTITKLVSHMPCALLHMKISTTSLLPWCLCPKEGGIHESPSNGIHAKIVFQNCILQWNLQLGYPAGANNCIRREHPRCHTVVHAVHTPCHLHHRHDKNIQKHCLRVCTVNFYPSFRTRYHTPLVVYGLWAGPGLPPISLSAPSASEPGSGKNKHHFFGGKKNRLVIATMGLLWTLSHLVGTMQLPLQHLGPPVQEHLRIHL